MSTATLIDGTVVDSGSAQWQHECLARHVLNRPNLAARREWLADFERRNGLEKAEQLRTTMLALHERAKS